jgi:D-lactate dehydrogenase
MSSQLWQQLPLPPERVKTDLSSRVALASDASFYYLIPQAIVLPNSVEEIVSLFQFSHTHGISLTFRAAGTSLSGQAVTEDILVDLSRFWREAEVLNLGLQVRAQPGVIGGHLNALLRPYHRKIGPDPASINACMLGGILANNASGMCCGVAQNAYHTLVSLKCVLPSGQVIDSSEDNAQQKFLENSPELAQGLIQLRQAVLNNASLTQRIRSKYLSKNTVGYSLNALIDYSEPLDILTHLLIGSEGTLAFIAEAVLETVPDDPFKYTGLLIFADMQSACEAIQTLNQSGVKALELMDRASLRAIEAQTTFDWLPALPAQAAALLLEYQASSQEALNRFIQAADHCLAKFELLRPALLTLKPEEQAQLWKIRKGLFPSIGAIRAQGTTVIIEDVAFPLEFLAEAVSALQDLFALHKYHDAIIFGHARDGNLHFVITQSFNTAEETARYRAFMDDLVALVIHRFKGALKAEHGTGRNMAPFVETEWGPDAYALMLQLKDLFDPLHLLNPGVIINPNPLAHITNLKTLPIIETEVDRCIECGFCEKYCPSRDLSLTPRQRIVLRREMQRLKSQTGQEAAYKILTEDYAYAALETCATDGLCASACPVGIDTGLLVKRLRNESHSHLQHLQAEKLAQNFGALEKTLRMGLWAGEKGHHYLGAKRINRFLKLTLSQFLSLPEWPSEWPALAQFSPILAPVEKEYSADWVYYPSCITRNMGYRDQPCLPEILVKLATRAGIRLSIVDQALCCGLPFSSKGFKQAGAFLLNQSIEFLWEISKAGTLAIVVDNSPCSWQMLSSTEMLSSDNLVRFKKMRIVDSVVFSQEVLLPALKPHPLPRSVVVHPVCSIQKMGLEKDLLAVVSACAEKAEVPFNAGCCGFAGDRGYLVPELTAAATAVEAKEIAQGDFQGYYCSSRTCELGLERSTSENWYSYLYLLAEAIQ